MPGYHQFCPVAHAAAVLARRWTPLVVRELLSGSRRFNDLHRGVPKMSRTLLSRRLRELEEAGVVARRTVGECERPEYHLTEAGKALRPVIAELGVWGKRWLRWEMPEEDPDASLLMWDVQRRIEWERLPPRRVVVHFRFTDAPLGCRDFWLVLEGEAVDLRQQDPGGGEDLMVCSDVGAFTAIWLGDVGLRHAIKERTVWVGGPAELRRQLPEWLGLSAFAGVCREPASRGTRGSPRRGPAPAAASRER